MARADKDERNEAIQRKAPCLENSGNVAPCGCPLFLGGPVILNVHIIDSISRETYFFGIAALPVVVRAKLAGERPVERKRKRSHAARREEGEQATKRREAATRRQEGRQEGRRQSGGGRAGMVSEFVRSTQTSEGCVGSAHVQERM